MKKETLDINRYLEQVGENFSGYNGYAEDLEFSGAGGNAPVQAIPRTKAPTPTPYQVSVSNTTGGNLTAVLFGGNEFLQTANFGSAAALVVAPSQTNVTYLQLLNQSMQQPFETSLLRINSTNTAQVTQPITVTSTDANGQTCSTPLIVDTYFSANQFQATRVDVPFALTIDGNTNIASVILAGATVIYTFFPAEKVNPTRALRGGAGNPLKQYAAPTVPIIANTRPESYPMGNGLEKY